MSIQSLRRSNLRKREYRRNNNLCMECGGKRDNDKLKCCSVCLKKERDRYHRKKLNKENNGN